MQLAHNALKEEGATVAELAHRPGYRSEAAFARALKRVVGIPPGAVKRASEAATDALDERVAGARRT
jgi:AraC-like DNA-binding protein